MKLSRLLDSLDDKEIVNFSDVEISGITGDSRHVQTGILFVAVRGTKVDGHDYIGSAVQQGAAACVTEISRRDLGVPTIIVKNSARALARLAAAINANPADGLWMCGVTGTNGKTSTVHLIRSIFDASSWGKVGVLGTIGHGVGDRLDPALHTTPDAVTLHKLLREMSEQNCIGVVMEVSSHAVRQQRIWGIDYDVGILMNVTHDHLDYHRTFEDYAAAKREFCFSLSSPSRRKKNGVLIYSRDNEVARKIGEAFSGEKLSVGINAISDVYAENIVVGYDGTRFDLHVGKDESIFIHLRLLGRFNVYNAMSAAAAGHVMGVELENIKAGLEAVSNIPGRFESIGGGSRPLVVVDYCHTPDSMENVLNFCVELEPEKLITVFGCGGDRDKQKRPVMGKIAQKISDECYVTSDNPRTEDPDKIIEDILRGMDRTDNTLHVELDRRQAIRAAIRSARRGDLVAVCGKGHEDYQIIGTTRHHFDDREEAQKALAEWEEH